MHFCVSQGQVPSWNYGLVCDVCFLGLLQLKSFLYTHTALAVIVGLCFSKQGCFYLKSVQMVQL